MASVWGVSWGSAWGNSWGTVSAVEPEPVQEIRPTGGWTEWPEWRRERKLLQTHLEAPPEVLKAVEVIAKRAVDGKTAQPKKALQTRLRVEQAAFDDAYYDLLQDQIARQRQEAIRQELLALGAIAAEAELRRQQELEDEEIVLSLLFDLC